MTNAATIKKIVWGQKLGLTDNVFSRLYNNKGTKILAIVELESEYTGDGIDGKHDVILAIKSVEPVVATNVAVESQLDEHVRTIKQALNYERRLTEAGSDEPLDLGEDTPRPPGVTDVLQQGKGLTEHDDQNNVTRLHDPSRQETPASV
jgi:hypothetical protein